MKSNAEFVGDHTGIPEEAIMALVNDAEIIEEIIEAHVTNMITAIDAADVNNGLAVSIMLQIMYKFAENAIGEDGVKHTIDALEKMKEEA